MIGVKPLFSGRSLADGASATFDVVVVAPDGTAVAQRGLHYELLRIDTHYQFYKRDGSWNYEPVKTTKRVADGTVDTTLDKAGAHCPAGDVRPLPARSLDRRCQRAGDVGRLRRRLLCRVERRYARHARSRARQGRVRAGRYHDGRGDRAQRRPAHPQCHRRSAAGEPDHRGQAWRRAGASAGRPRLGHRRLSGRDTAAAARRAGAAHAGPRHRRAMVRHRSRGENARRRDQGAVAVAAEFDVADSGEACRARRRRGRQDRGRRGRCRHSQSDQLQAAVARRLLSRPAGACGGNPRPLRRLDRRHAGHARADPQRRRPRRAIARQPAHGAAAGALFRHRDGRRRRQCRSDVRRARLHRHHPRHGGGVEQGQGRPRHGRRHCARSGRTHGDAAALPASGRPLQPSSRSRQCRGASRRLRDRRDECGRGQRRHWGVRRSSLCARRSAVPFPFRSPPPPRAAAPFGST